MVERDGRRIVREVLEYRRLAARHDHARHCAEKGLRVTAAAPALAASWLPTRMPRNVPSSYVRAEQTEGSSGALDGSPGRRSSDPGRGRRDGACWPSFGA